MWFVGLVVFLALRFALVSWWYGNQKHQADERSALFQSLRNAELFQLQSQAQDAMRTVALDPADSYVAELLGRHARVFLDFLNTEVDQLTASHVNFVAHGQLSRGNWRVEVFVEPHDLGCGKVNHRGFW